MPHSEPKEHALFIGGEWIPANSGATYQSIDPYRGVPWAIVPDADRTDVDLAADAARKALDGEWGQASGFQRAAWMRDLAREIRNRSEDLAVCETRDNGKLLREMRGQIEYIPEWLDYFSGIADKLEGATIPSDRDNFFIYTRREPVGVVGAIAPWNSPLLLMMWKLAPALAAGCTFIVKPSDYTPVSTLMFAECVEAAGLPGGTFNVVTGKGAKLGQALVDHPGVDKIAFTGSTRVGIEVAKTAASRLARVSLELGGKSAQVVFDDTDLEAATNGVVAGIFAASGQTCIAGSRLVVQRTIHDELVERLVERAERIKLGDPSAADTEMGPLANQSQFETVTGFIDRAVVEGATLATGGPRPDAGDLFVGPTILTNVAPDAEIACDEVFGPVLAVIPFDTEEDAIEIANSTDFGLAAGVWTSSVHRAHRVASRLRAGTVWVNSYRVVAPNAPFGGPGMSGWGRESGIESVYQYTETKTVWIETEGRTRDPFVIG